MLENGWLKSSFKNLEFTDASPLTVNCEKELEKMQKIFLLS